MSKDIKVLLQKDFNGIFSDMILFIEHIPQMAKLTGVVEFIKQMELTRPQYYRRINNHDLWTISELQRAKKIFQDHGLGKLK